MLPHLKHGRTINLQTRDLSAPPALKYVLQAPQSDLSSTLEKKSAILIQGRALGAVKYLPDVPDPVNGSFRGMLMGTHAVLPL